MTLVGLLNAKDPALASFLGIQTGSLAHEQAERQERQAAIQCMQELTEATRQRTWRASFIANVAILLVSTLPLVGGSSDTYWKDAPLRQLHPLHGQRLSDLDGLGPGVPG